MTEQVAGNIRAEMARRKVSQQAVAAHLGLSQQAVSSRLNGRTSIDVQELAAIADLLEVQAGSLLGESIAVAS